MSILYGLSKGQMGAQLKAQWYPTLLSHSTENYSHRTNECSELQDLFIEEPQINAAPHFMLFDKIIVTTTTIISLP